MLKSLQASFENSRQMRLLLIYFMLSAVMLSTNPPMLFSTEDGTSRRLGLDVTRGNTPLPWWILAILLSVMIERVLEA